MANLSGTSTDKDAPGVSGENNEGTGVRGMSKSGTGVLGTSESGVAVWGGSQSSSGVGGMTDSGIGVHGVAKSGVGVRGDSETWQGVYGHSNENAGVVGESDRMHAVFGITHSTFAGVYGASDAGGTGVAGESNTGIGVHGKGGRLAGFFEGDVEVTGDVRLANADCAEDFDVSGAVKVEPGTVMVLGHEGVLSESQHAYDKRVAGVISGAGDYKPGIVLDKQQTSSNRQPIALMGKVFCKVDAQYGAIDIGDLLTTSPTPGHAMKTSDPLKAFGAVIGKALRPWSSGQGLIPILIALQ
jgi:hypothetical protein